MALKRTHDDSSDAQFDEGNRFFRTKAYEFVTDTSGPRPRVKCVYAGSRYTAVLTSPAGVARYPALEGDGNLGGLYSPTPDKASLEVSVSMDTFGMRGAPAGLDDHHREFFEWLETLGRRFAEHVWAEPSWMASVRSDCFAVAKTIVGGLRGAPPASLSETDREVIERAKEHFVGKVSLPLRTYKDERLVAFRTALIDWEGERRVLPLQDSQGASLADGESDETAIHHGDVIGLAFYPKCYMVPSGSFGIRLVPTRVCLYAKGGGEADAAAAPSAPAYAFSNPFRAEVASA